MKVRVWLHGFPENCGIIDYAPADGFATVCARVTNNGTLVLTQLNEYVEQDMVGHAPGEWDKFERVHLSDVRQGKK